MISQNHVSTLIERYPDLAVCRRDIEKTVAVILDSYQRGGKILLCGNGGSAADCEHISGELLKGFLLKRTPEDEELTGLSLAIGSENAAKLQRGIPAIPLCSLSAAMTAFSNDVSAELVYAQLTYAIGKKGDTLICISTSGNSRNAVLAAKTARQMGITTVALTGKAGGELKEICDITVTAPEKDTFKVQELHLPIYHAICAEVERILF